MGSGTIYKIYTRRITCVYPLRPSRSTPLLATTTNIPASCSATETGSCKTRKERTLDPDETAEVQYGSGQKKSSPGAGKKTGTDALKINVNTGGTGGAGTGGLNV